MLQLHYVAGTGRDAPCSPNGSAGVVLVIGATPVVIGANHGADADPDGESRNVVTVDHPDDGHHAPVLGVCRLALAVGGLVRDVAADGAAERSWAFPDLLALRLCLDCQTV